VHLAFKSNPLPSSSPSFPVSETTTTNGVKPKSRKELLKDKEFEEALKETLKEEKPIALTSNDFNVFLLFAVSTAVTVVAYFADKWHLRTRNDIIMLLGLGVALFVGLRDSYTRQAKIALNRFKASATAAGGSLNEDQIETLVKKSAWYGVFVVSFWFFSLFGFLASTVVPFWLPVEVRIPPLSHIYVNAWTHTLVSSLLPLVLVVLSAHNVI
jgi:hypothetical protein